MPLECGGGPNHTTTRSGRPGRYVARTNRRALAHAGRSVEEGHTSALVVLVARHGTIVLHEAFGRSGGSTDAVLGTSAIFPLMSIGKVITATSVMILVEDGEVGLNRPVQEYLPEFLGDGKDRVMVHHLLSHSSRLVDDDVVAHQEQARGRVLVPPTEPNQHPRVHELLWLRWDAPLSKPPGTEMSYSGPGYALLAEVVRRRSGMNIGEFARQRIFEPLGMRDSFYAVPERALPRLVHRPADYPDAARLEDPEFRDIPGGSVGATRRLWTWPFSARPSSTVAVTVPPDCSARQRSGR